MPVLLVEPHAGASTLCRKPLDLVSLYQDARLTVHVVSGTASPRCSRSSEAVDPFYRLKVGVLVRSLFRSEFALINVFKYYVNSNYDWCSQLYTRVSL